MTNNDLMTAVRTVLLRGLAEYGYGDWAVQQNYQPSQVGTNDKPTVYIHHLNDVPVGCALTSEEWDETEGVFIQTERQVMTTRVQVSATVMIMERDLENPLSPVDILREARFALQSRAAIATLLEMGLAVMRVSDLPSYDFLNDSPGYAKRPTFDIIFQHSQSWQSRFAGVNTVRPRHVGV